MNSERDDVLPFPSEYDAPCVIDEGSAEEVFLGIGIGGRVEMETICDW
jgi:hypothetical protein